MTRCDSGTCVSPPLLPASLLPVHSREVRAANALLLEARSHVAANQNANARKAQRQVGQVHALEQEASPTPPPTLPWAVIASHHGCVLVCLYSSPLLHHTRG